MPVSNPAPSVAEESKPVTGATTAAVQPNAMESTIVGLGCVTNLRSSLGADASISGKLSFSKPTRIDGTLKGEVRSTDLLVVGESASIDGTIHAARVIILGRVHGDIRGAERVEIGPTGKLRGNLDSGVIVVHEGAILDGDCKVVPAQRATVHILHPRDGEPGEAAATK